MRGSARSLLRQASVLMVLCCACAVGASEALAQDPAPEPAPPKSSGPKPEAPPGASRQPQAPATKATPNPPPPPPAAPPPPPPTTPPPAAVTPPPPPAVTRVYQRPATQTRRGKQAERREPARPKSKDKAKPKNDRVKVAAAATPTLTRDQATSPDTLLLVGGLALFFLVLADIVFLTLSTRVLRAR